MLTNISKVADNVFAWTVVNGFSLVQQYQSIEKWKNGMPRLMDRHNHVFSFICYSDDLAKNRLTNHVNSDGSFGADSSFQ